MSTPTIEELTRREYSAAKLGWTAVVVMQLLGLVLALLGSHDTGKWSIALGALGFVGPVSAAWLRKWYQGHQSRGDELRRVMLARMSWARQIAQDTLLAGLAEHTSLPSLDPEPMGGYYASEREAGSRRFLDNLAESAFFTTGLSATLAFLYLATSLAIGYLGFTMLWAVAKGWLVGHGLPDPTQLPSAIIAFSVGNEFFNAGLAYQNLRAVASTTLQRCATLRTKSKQDSVELMMLLCTYDCALTQSPPIPGFVYRLRRKTLDRNWKAHGQADVRKTVDIAKGLPT